MSFFNSSLSCLFRGNSKAFVAVKSCQCPAVSQPLCGFALATSTCHEPSSIGNPGVFPTIEIAIPSTSSSEVCPSPSAAAPESYNRFGLVEDAVVAAVNHKLNNKKTVFLICNPGRSAIPEALIHSGARRVIIMEPRRKMQEKWRNLSSDHLFSSQRVEFHDYNFHRGSKTDRDDRAIDEILDGVEQVPFGDESNVCVIGGVAPAAVEASSLRYLNLKAMTRQYIFKWGEVEYYPFVRARKALILEGSPRLRTSTAVRGFIYRYLFDVQHLTSFHGSCLKPPVVPPKVLLHSGILEKENYDTSRLYLFRMRAKHVVNVAEDEIPGFCFFVRQFGLQRAKQSKNKLFPFLNHWVPNSADLVAEWNDQLTQKTLCHSLPLEDTIHLYKAIRQSPNFDDSPLAFEMNNFAEQLQT